MVHRGIAEFEVAPNGVTVQTASVGELHETWELHGNVPSFATEDDIDRVILPLVKH